MKYRESINTSIVLYNRVEYQFDFRVAQVLSILHFVFITFIPHLSARALIQAVYQVPMSRHLAIRA